MRRFCWNEISMATKTASVRAHFVWFNRNGKLNWATDNVRVERFVTSIEQLYKTVSRPFTRKPLRICSHLARKTFHNLMRKINFSHCYGRHVNQIYIFENDGAFSAFSSNMKHFHSSSAKKSNGSTAVSNDKKRNFFSFSLAIIELLALECLTETISMTFLVWIFVWFSRKWLSPLKCDGYIFNLIWFVLLICIVPFQTWRIDRNCFDIHLTHYTSSLWYSIFVRWIHEYRSFMWRHGVVPIKHKLMATKTSAKQFPTLMIIRHVIYLKLIRIRRSC